ncbi:unnamed protein product [Trichobilharzia regenti]|nr:unnamed protein product [Trichobilharzia regenti]
MDSVNQYSVKRIIVSLVIQVKVLQYNLQQKRILLIY